MYRTLTSPVRRYPLIAFFILAYAISWCLVPIGGFLPFGPLVAALVIVPITGGRAGLKELGSRMIRWRVRWYWYVLAMVVPLAVLLAAVAMNVGLGAAIPSLSGSGSLSALLMVFAVRLINPLDGPLGEEPGWRGFALPGLQATRSPLASAVILAVLVAGWHLPLLLPQFGGSPFDLLGTVGVTIWYVWLFNRTSGSVLITLIAHSAEGIFQYGAFWSAGADVARMGLLYALAWCALAVALVVLDRKAWRSADPNTMTIVPEPRTA